MGIYATFGVTWSKEHLHRPWLRQGYTHTHTALCSSLGLDITIVPGDKQDTYINPFLTAFFSSDLPLSSALGLFCLSPSASCSLYHVPTIFADHNSAKSSILKSAGQAHSCFLPSQVKLTRWGCGFLLVAWAQRSQAGLWHNLIL